MPTRRSGGTRPGGRGVSSASVTSSARASQSVWLAGGLWRLGSRRPLPIPTATAHRACLLVKTVREPDAVAPHVRFEERRRETESWLGYGGTRNRKGEQQIMPDQQPPRPPSTPLHSQHRRLRCHLKRHPSSSLGSLGCHVPYAWPRVFCAWRPKYSGDSLALWVC